MKNILFVILTCSLFALSCQKEDVRSLMYANPDGLSNLIGLWKFVGYSPDNQTPAYHVTLEIKQQEDVVIINGQSSVNFYFATLSLKQAPNIIEFSALGSTKIAGTQEANSFEMKYYERLQKINSYTIKDNTLIFNSNSNNETIIYTRLK